jgi:hypothetical protein
MQQVPFPLPASEVSFRVKVHRICVKYAFQMIGLTDRHMYQAENPLLGQIHHFLPVLQ